VLIEEREHPDDGPPLRDKLDAIIVAAWQRDAAPAGERQ
jgi:hypothetical protein